MEHPPDGVIRFKRWLNAVFEAWIEKRPLYVIIFLSPRDFASIRSSSSSCPYPFELTGVTFRDHLHTLSSPIVSPIRAARVDSSRSRMDLVFSLREH